MSFLLAGLELMRATSASTSLALSLYLALRMTTANAASSDVEALHNRIAALAGDKPALMEVFVHCQRHYPELEIDAAVTLATWRKRNDRYFAAFPGIQATPSTDGAASWLAPLLATKGNGAALCVSYIGALASGKYDLSASEVQLADRIIGDMSPAPSHLQRLQDASYAAAVRQKIRERLVYSPPVGQVGNAKAKFKIRVFSDGTILAIERLESSDWPDYDDAIIRAIRQASPLPRLPDARSAHDIELHFQMR